MQRIVTGGFRPLHFHSQQHCDTPYLNKQTEHAIPLPVGVMRQFYFFGFSLYSSNSRVRKSSVKTLRSPYNTQISRYYVKNGVTSCFFLQRGNESNIFFQKWGTNLQQSNIVLVRKEGFNDMLSFCSNF